MQLLRRAARGGALLGIGQAAGTGLDWATTIVLARLLTPKDYGLVGMAAVLLGFLGAVSDLGLTAAVVQRKDLDDAHKDAAFWSSLTMGVVLFAVSTGAAPLLALFYGEPRLTSIVMVAALPLLLGPFWTTHAALLRKELRFGTLARIEVFRTLLGGVVAITAAALGAGVWALLVAPIARHFAAIALYTMANPSWRPGLRATRKHVRDLLSFSLYVAGAGAINFFSANLDYLIVGKVLGLGTLGVYKLAYETMTFPLTRISSLFSQVLFPAFSKIQDDLDAMREAYTKTSRTLALVSFPILGLVGVAAPELIRVVYGPQWMGAAPLLRVFCVAGALKSVGTLVGVVYKSRGKASVELWWNVAWVSALAPAIYFGVHWRGMEGVAIAITLLTIPGTFFTEWLACHYIALPFSKLLRVFALPAAGALGSVALAAFFARLPWAPFSREPADSAVRLVMLGVITLGAYAAVLRLVYAPIVGEARAFLGYFRKER